MQSRDGAKEDFENCFHELIPRAAHAQSRDTVLHLGALSSVDVFGRTGAGGDCKEEEEERQSQLTE